MTVFNFIVGMLFVLVTVTLWSLIDSASITTVILRGVLCAIVLQAGYFLWVVWQSFARTKTSDKEQIDRENRSSTETAKAGADKGLFG